MTHPPRNYPINSLGHTKSLHFLALIQSLSNFQRVSALYTQYFTSQCWNQQLQIRFLIVFNPHPHQSLSMMNQNLKSLKSLTPRLTTDVVPASYCILSVGQGMRALMKKLPGSSLPNLDMFPKSLWISTLHIQPSLVLCQVFDLGAFHFNLKSYFKFTLLQVKKILFTILLLIVESSTSPSPAPKFPSKPWEILLRSPFCSLNSPLTSMTPHVMS